MKRVQASILEVQLVGRSGAIIAKEPKPLVVVILLHAPAEQIIASTVIKTLQTLQQPQTVNNHCKGTHSKLKDTALYS